MKAKLDDLLRPRNKARPGAKPAAKPKPAAAANEPRLSRQRKPPAMPADDWRREKNKHYQEPLLTRNLNLVEVLKQIGTPHGHTPGEVAIAWVLRHPAVTAAIVGARKPGQLKELVGAADWQLTSSEADAIDTFLKANPA